MNTLVITGTVKKGLTLKNIKDDLNNEYYEILVEVARNYKNLKGEYEIDLIPCLIKGDLIRSLDIKVNDFIGVRGHIERLYGNDFTANGNAIISVIVEKITILGSISKESV